MIGPSNSPLELALLIFKEGKKRLLMVAGLFSIVALLALAVGLNMPKKWDASATLLAEDTNIIKPLMDGRAVTTSVADSTALVTQTVLSRRIMREVLTFGGWLSPPPAPQPDPREEEKMIAKLRGRIKIDSPRDGLIRIGYSDSDQKRSYKIANELARIYVRESTESRERESREAFDFIDQQVNEYGKKLTESHEAVLTYYKQQDAPQPAPTTADNPAPRPKPKGSPEELARLRADEAALVMQLGKTQKPIKKSEEAQREVDRARARAADLQVQLDRALATFTEAHPDVKRLRHELTAIHQEEERAEQALGDQQRAADQASAMDDDITARTRAQLDQVRAKIAVLTGRPVRHRASSAASTVADELRVDPEMRTVGSDSKLSELLRQYESTRDIYQDLLKRRENARVSMLLDAERRGLTLRIHEAAEMPVIPNSLRLSQITAIGLVFAMMVPIGILFGFVSLDRRVRAPQQIAKLAKVPLLVSINYTPERRAMTRERKRTLVAAGMVGCVFLVYAAAFIVKLKMS